MFNLKLQETYVRMLKNNFLEKDFKMHTLKSRTHFVIKISEILLAIIYNESIHKC